MPNESFRKFLDKWSQKRLLRRLYNTGPNQPQEMRSKFVEFVVLQLIYAQGQMHTLMMSKYSKTPSGTPVQIADWYAQTLCKERRALEPGIRVRFKDWRILSGDENLFTVGSVLFEQIYIFLGADSCHWIFFKNNPTHLRIEGSGYLRFSYCGCCLWSQYRKVVEQIKGRIISQMQSV